MISNLYKRWVNILILLAVSLGLVFFVDLKSVGMAIASIPLNILIVVFFLATLDRFFMGYKWHHLILAAGGKLKLRHAVSAYYQSGLGSRLIPVPLGSELLRAHLIFMEGVPGSVVFGSMAMEKMLAFIVSSLLALIGLIYLLAEFQKDIRDILLLSILLGLTAGSITLTISLSRSAHNIGGKFIDKYLPQKLINPLRQFSLAILKYRNQPKVIVINAFLVIAEQMLQFTKFFYLGRALNIDLPLFTFFAIISLTILVRRITGYLEGVGLGEIGSVVILIIFGVSRETAVTLILMNYAVTFAASLPGLYLFYRSGANLKNLIDPNRKSVVL